MLNDIPLHPLRRRDAFKFGEHFGMAVSEEAFDPGVFKQLADVSPKKRQVEHFVAIDPRR